MEIIFLGTSGSGVSKTRNLPSLIVDRSILFDCGEGCLQSLRKMDIPLDRLTHIFITHFHADHVLGLLAIIFAMAFYEKIEKFPPIYVPEGMKENLQTLLDITSTSLGLQRAGYEIEIHELTIEHDTPISLHSHSKSYNIDWMRTKHAPICFAYKINKSVVYSGDSAPFDEMIEFSSDVKILIHEATLPDDMKESAEIANHTTPIDAASIAHKSGVEELFLIHTSNLAETDPSVFLKQAVDVFSNIKIAKDHQIIHL